jgi:hypothetical protein
VAPYEAKVFINGFKLPLSLLLNTYLLFQKYAFKTLTINPAVLAII